MKVCKGCGGEFLATTEFFHADKKGVGGLKERCKVCRCKEASEYRANNPEQARASCRESHYRHREQRLEHQREYLRKNCETLRAKVKAWKACNRDWVRVSKRDSEHRRRARLLGNQVLPVDYEAVNKRLGMVCGICLEPIEGEFHYDHIMPIAQGGSHSTENLQLAHPVCNIQKGATWRI